MLNRSLLGFGLVFGLITGGCGSDAGSLGGSGGTGGTGGSSFVPPEYGTWVKYEPEGATCSDGSQYKFWVEFSETSDNLIIFFEGGGACWDYESCSGNGGIRGAANPNGLPDTHADSLYEIAGIEVGASQVYPLLNQDPAVSPMADWNKVFVGYCTGDVYSGDRTVTYQDPSGVADDLVFHHVGHRNVLAMTGMLDEMFPTVPKLFVGGCSAGGAGAIVNYYFLRTGIHGVDKGYLLDDSGPIYPDQAATSRSFQLHQRVRSSWDADKLIDSAPRSEELKMDFGNLNTVLAEEFPNDRLATTYFRLDYNYSLYSYERFWTRDGESIVPYMGDGLGLEEDVALDRAAIYSLWWDDTALLRAQYDDKSNLGYYIPFYRTTNDSHCVTIPGLEEFGLGEALNLFENDFATLAWAGSEIGDTSLRDYVENLLNDDEPLESFFEEDAEGPYVSCTPTPADFDAGACEAAVNP
ncbi:MAG: pectin acetylesterase-family hydrolase [Polyangiales bacterium]